MPDVEAGATYEGRVGLNYRLFASHNGKHWPILFFSVGRDGSLYAGPYSPRADGAKSGTISGQELMAPGVQYEDGLPFREANSSDAKVSFHTSGVVHYDRKRGFALPFPTRDPVEPICRILPARPNAKDYKIDAEIRPKRDILTGFPICDGQPCWVEVYYSVGLAHQLRDRGDEWKTIVVYRDLHRIGAAILELTILRGSEGVWPPYAYLIARAEPDEASAPASQTQSDL